VVAVDPFDDSALLSGSQQLFRSTDGGGKWNRVIDYGSPHEDQHRIAFDPLHQDVVYAANDGGVFRSVDGGATWTTTGDSAPAGVNLNQGLVTAQFYHAGIAGSVAVGDVYHSGYIGSKQAGVGDWQGVQGHSWEASGVYGDAVRPEWFWGNFWIPWSGFGPRSDLSRQHYSTSGPDSFSSVGPFPPRSIAFPPPPAARAVLVGTGDGRVMRSLNPDDPTPTWQSMGGISSPVAVSALVVAATGDRRAYAINDNGTVFACNNTDSGGWTQVGALPDINPRAAAVSPADSDKVFAITVGAVYRSMDGGHHWSRVGSSGPRHLPGGLELRSLLAPLPGLLYLGAVSGVYASPDNGATWFSKPGLPNVEVEHLVFNNGSLYAVTHGRGIWHYDVECWPFFDWPPALHHRIDIKWLIETWLAIHGGDPPEWMVEALAHGVKSER
jgi:hypothetical protein